MYQSPDPQLPLSDELELELDPESLELDDEQLEELPPQSPDAPPPSNVPPWPDMLIVLCPRSKESESPTIGMVWTTPSDPTTDATGLDALGDCLRGAGHPYDAQRRSNSFSLASFAAASASRASRRFTHGNLNPNNPVNFMICLNKLFFT